MRLIDADRLKMEIVEEGQKSKRYRIGKFWELNREEIWRTIDEQPTVQPERKRGKWIYGEHDVAMCDGYRCDKCGFFVPWDYQHKFIDFINDYHFCPSCGADMRGEQDGRDD